MEMVVLMCVWMEGKLVLSVFTRKISVTEATVCLWPRMLLTWARSRAQVRLSNTNKQTAVQGDLLKTIIVAWRTVLACYSSLCALFSSEWIMKDASMFIKMFEWRTGSCNLLRQHRRAKKTHHYHLPVTTISVAIEKAFAVQDKLNKPFCCAWSMNISQSELCRLNVSSHVKATTAAILMPYPWCSPWKEQQQKNNTPPLYTRALAQQIGASILEAWYQVPGTLHARLYVRYTKLQQCRWLVAMVVLGGKDLCQ